MDAERSRLTATISGDPNACEPNPRTDHRERASGVEEKILALLREGDPQGVSELMASYQDRLFSLAYSICGDYGDTEEVLQDVYLIALRKINCFEGRASLFTWLHRVTENAALMKRRSKRHVRRTIPLDDVGAAALEDDSLTVFTERKKAPQEELLQKELGEKIRDSLHNLPEIYRQVLYLRDVQGYSTREASRMLQLTPAAVKSRLHRSRLMLREDLKGYCWDN
jgi:RNA polymerase sigma-70 factor (ECF subfamily)